MTFTNDERAILLAVKGVGPTVVQRFEQLGLASLAELARQDAEAICVAASALVGSTCWKNSPQAKSAVVRAIETARVHTAA